MSDETLEDEQAPPVEEMPSGMERRLVLRLMAYWRDLFSDGYDDDADQHAYGRRYPARSEIDRSEIPEVWPSCFILELPRPGAEAVFGDAGDEYAAQYPGRLNGLRLSELTPDTLAEKSTFYLPEVIAKGVPVTRGGEFTNRDGDLVLYRSIILPLSNDGNTVDGFIGAANCRIVAKE